MYNSNMAPPPLVHFQICPPPVPCAKLNFAFLVCALIATASAFAWKVGEPGQKELFSNVFAVLVNFKIFGHFNLHKGGWGQISDCMREGDTDF